MLGFRQSTLRKRTQRHHPKMSPRSPLVRWLFRSALALFATLSVLAGAQARAEPGGSLTFIEVRAGARGHVAHILRDQARARRKHTSPPAQIIPLQEISRPVRFALVDREQSVVLREPEIRAGRNRHEVGCARPLVRDCAPGPGASRSARPRKNNIAMQQSAVAARQSDANLGFVGWNSESPFHAFAATRAAREFRQIVGPMSGSPYDERSFRRVD